MTTPDHTRKSRYLRSTVSTSALLLLLHVVLSPLHAARCDVRGHAHGCDQEHSAAHDSIAAQFVTWDPVPGSTPATCSVCLALTHTTPGFLDRTSLIDVRNDAARTPRTVSELSGVSSPRRDDLGRAPPLNFVAF